VVCIEAATTKGDVEMGFRQIGQIALDGVSLDLQMKIERAVEGSACEALTLRSTAGKATTAREGGSGQPSMQHPREVGTGAAMGEKGGGIAASLLPVLVWTNPDRVTMHGRAVTAATGSPIPAARPYLVALNGMRAGHRSHPI
jgi:hypothetical protein